MRKHLRAILEVCAVAGIIAGLGFIGLKTWLPVRVGGLSMHPALHAGDVVLVHRSRRPRIGDVALLRAEGHDAVLHRVTQVVADGSLRTRGDANPVEDATPVEPAEVRGTVEAVLPLGLLLERWRGGGEVRYHGGSTEQSQATTEKTSAQVPIEQGTAP